MRGDRTSIRAFLASALILLCAAPAWTQDRQRPALSDLERQRIEAAVPAAAPARPAKPRRLLVSSLGMFKGQEVRGHTSIPAGNHALDQIGRRTGAYEAVFSNDIDMFRPGVIDQFDAICFNNTVGVLFEDPELRASLLGFIAGGNGFVGFHAAAATFVQYPVYDQWPPFGKMLGGTENGGHPWGPNEPFYVKVEDPDSPLNDAFKGEGIRVSDESYQLQESNPRDYLHVLLSLDMQQMGVAGRKILPARRDDLDFPVSWIKRHEKGRVFYTTLGHNPHVFWDPKLLAHFLAGIQYALGDLQADDSPDGKR